MQSLAEELSQLRLDLGLQVDGERGPEGVFCDGHEVAATRKVATSSCIEASVNLVGGSFSGVRAETGMRIKISGVKKTSTDGSFPGRSMR
jgi:hypothetical protein